MTIYWGFECVLKSSHFKQRLEEVNTLLHSQDDLATIWSFQAQTIQKSIYQKIIRKLQKRYPSLEEEVFEEEWKRWSRIYTSSMFLEVCSDVLFDLESLSIYECCWECLINFDFHTAPIEGTNGYIYLRYQGFEGDQNLHFGLEISDKKEVERRERTVNEFERRFQRPFVFTGDC